MSDRTDEATTSRESEPARSTEDVLAETERLLSETGGSSSDEGGPGGASGHGLDDRSETDGVSTPSIGTEPREGTSGDGDTSDATAGGLRSRLTPTGFSVGRLLSPGSGRLFSPRAFLALVLALGAGTLVGGATLPFGRLLGLAAVAFLTGVAASTRRYLEVGAAGLSVGVTAALLDNAVLTLVGAGGTLAAVGAGTGFLACIVGYYFGRDLRNGLATDL